MTRLIFLGPPGAGKGTQAKVLANLLQIAHISTGDILRQAIALKTALGIKAQPYLDRGDLVPDVLMIELIRERLTQPDAAQGWILDGFPRNVLQASFLDKLLQEIDQDYDSVVNLEVPDEVLVSRLLLRGRRDDTEAVVRHRLLVYWEQTEPLINFYRERQQLVSIDGNMPPDDVTNEMKKLIHS